MIIKPVASAAGEFQDNAFLYPIRIYYEDTDAGGIVYYANYLKFAERARTEFVRALGCRQQDDLECDNKGGFVVRHCEIDFQAPAVLDDELTVRTRVTDLSGASATMFQEIMRNDQLLVTVDVKLAYMSLKNKRPTRIPKDLAAKIEKYL